MNAVEWAPDGTLLASAAADSTVRIWDRATGEERHRFEGHRTSATAIGWHPRGHTAVSASRDGTVRLWATDPGHELARFEDYGGEVFAVAFNPAGTLLASGTQEGVIGIWAFASGKQVLQLGSQVRPIQALAFGPNSQTLATGSEGVIQLWGSSDGIPQAPVTVTLSGDQTPHSLALNINETMLAAGFREGPLAWWQRSSDDKHTFERQAPLPSHAQASVAALAFSPNDQRLAAGFADGTIQVLDLATHKLQVTLSYPAIKEDPRRLPETRTVAFSPDSQRLVAGFADGSLFLWHLEEETLVSRAVLETRGDPLDVRFVSPKRILFVLRNGNLCVWDTPETTTRLISSFERRLSAAALGLAGDLVAMVADGEGLVRVETRRSARDFELSRALLASDHANYWVDCRSGGQCYRYDDGTFLLRREIDGELRPVDLQRSTPGPELELAEPLPQLITVPDGTAVALRLKLRNPGPQRAIWVSLRQAALEPEDPVVFYPPPVQTVIEPGQTIEFLSQVSMQSPYDSPESGEAKLQLVVTSAGGKHQSLAPINIANTVPAIKWQGARIPLGIESLIVDLAISGPLSAGDLTLLTPDLSEPANLSTDPQAELEARFVWEFPQTRGAEVPRRLDFAAYKTQLPTHRWAFSKQRVLRFPFDRPGLYVLLLLVLLAAAAYIRPRLGSQPKETATKKAHGLRGWVGDPQVEYAHLAIVFTDIVRSTELLGNLKIAGWAMVRNQHFDRTQHLTKKFGGYIVKSIGDGSMLAFRSSIDAVKFAVEIESQPGHEEIQVRVGVHVGEVQIDRDDAHGPVVHLASRVMNLAENGGVRVSHRVKADYDSAFRGDHHPYRWIEIADQEIRDFAEQENAWEVQYRHEDGISEGEEL